MAEWWRCQVEWNPGGFTYGDGSTEEEANRNLDTNILNDKVNNNGFSTIASRKCFLLASDPDSTRTPNPTSSPSPTPTPSIPPANIIYAVDSANRLLWFKHTDFDNGSASWAESEAKQIGNGWDFNHLFCGGYGTIYAVDSANRLLWFNHNGYDNGSASWAESEAKQIGTNWDFKCLFSMRFLGS